MNQAVANHLIIGRDLIFSFGPLASLYTTVYHPATDTLMIGGRSLIAGAFCAGFLMALWGRRIILLSILPVYVAVTLLSAPDSIFFILPFLGAIVIFRIASAPDAKIHLPLTGSVICGLAVLCCGIGVSPLVKCSFTAAIASNAVIVIIIGILGRRLRLALSMVGLEVVTLCLAMIVTGQPSSAIYQYFFAQADIVSGYAAAMFIMGPFLNTFIVIGALGCIVGVSYLTIESESVQWPIVLALALTLFLAFKAGYVRQDGHQVITSGTFFLVVLATTSLLKERAALVMVFLAGLGWCVTLKIGPYSAVAALEHAVVSFVGGIDTPRGRDAKLQVMFSQANEKIRRASPIPDVVGTADIYPMNLSALFAKGTPTSIRPVIQSYSVYTAGLGAINAGHLLGTSAPDHIFFKVEPIDGRLPALDDAQSWPVIFSKYQIVALEDTYIHLVHTPLAPLAQPSRDVKTAMAALDEWVDVPSGAEPVWARIDLHLTAIGRLMLAAFKVPQVNISVLLNDGRVIQHRYIPGIGQGGFLLSPYVGATEDVVLMAAGMNYNTVSKVKVTTNNYGQWAPTLRFDFAVLDIKPQDGAIKTIVTEPRPASTAVLNVRRGAQANCSIDGLSQQGGGIVTIYGWAAPQVLEGKGPDEVWISLTDAAGNSTFFRASSADRNDVRLAFNQPNMKEPGYRAYLDRRALKGPQTLKVYAIGDGEAWDCGLNRFLDAVGPASTPKDTGAVMK